ncbi:ExeA family protein [Desulfogranum mediterraneum]|uniref:ExeA family protein n=1 Tax=Desulfogranum mediterraneum TaxID=160661 RepID=UPI0004267D4A|nr:AAA family ATPase [Desulfogranum mediterraneum]
MYEKYYGLTCKPFQLTPDSRVVFRSEGHQEALAILKYGILSKKGFLVLTANVGLGKTTLLQALVDSLGVDVRLCLLNNPLLYRDEFFSYLGDKLGLPWDGNKARFLVDFEVLLKSAYARGERVLLIIDEAHVLPVELLEEIRLLSNLDVRGQDVLSIFLVGQPELNELMSADRFLPLRQRVGIRFDLQPFDLQATKQYILFRLRHAGARHLNLFSDEAIAAIHKVSRGTPRLINIVCDHALLMGFADSQPVITGPLIKECVQDLHFPGEANPLPIAESGRRGLQPGRMVLLVLGLLAIGCGLLVSMELLDLDRVGDLLENMIPGPWLEKIRMIFDQ